MGKYISKIKITVITWYLQLTIEPSENFVDSEGLGGFFHVVMVVAVVVVCLFFFSVFNNSASPQPLYFGSNCVKDLNGHQLHGEKGCVILSSLFSCV